MGEPPAEAAGGWSTRRVEHVMGTAVSVALAEPAPAAVFDRVFGWLRWVDEVFSTYRPDSQISRLARGETSVGDCDRQVRWILALCEWLRGVTGGFFDVHAGGGLDPSGVVKGWSAEVAGRLLVRAGVRRYCLNAGGDVRCAGEAPDGGPWRVGVVDPHRPGRVMVVVHARDLAVATSGVAERGLHVIDPHRGVGATELAAVTVVGPSLTLADGFATAAVAMGYAATRWLADLPGYCGLVVDASGDVWWSEGFARLAPGLPSGGVGEARTTGWSSG